MPLSQLQLKTFRRAQIVIRYFSKVNSTDIEECSVSGLQFSGEIIDSVITYTAIL